MKPAGLVLKFREEMQLTQAQLAARAGIHRNTIINIEDGHPMSAETAKRLCEVFKPYGVTLEQLLSAS